MPRWLSGTELEDLNIPDSALRFRLDNADSETVNFEEPSSLPLAASEKTRAAEDEGEGTRAWMSTQIVLPIEE